MPHYDFLDDQDGTRYNFPRCHDCVERKEEYPNDALVVVVLDEDSSGKFVGAFICYPCYEKRLEAGR